MPQAPSLKPRILLTNDDGIASPGLEALERVARIISDDVWIVAPEQEQSGAAHSLTLHIPVRVRQLGPKEFAVSGTPTDCVLLAAKSIIPEDKKPSLVLSGINRGSNTGDDITYSGTVAAAMEATLLGIPAIALSQLFMDGNDIHWETAEAHAGALIRRLLEIGWPEGSFINVNFPDCAKDEVQGIAFSPQGKRRASVALHPRSDPRGRPYFWIGGDRDNAAESAEVDVAMLDRRYITVTPLKLNMTDEATLKRLRTTFSKTGSRS